MKPKYRIYYDIKKSGCTKTEIEKNFEWPNGTIYKMCRTKNPNITKLKQIYDYINMPLDWFLN